MQLGPAEYESYAKRAMEFLGWTESREMTKADKDRFDAIVAAIARSNRSFVRVMAPVDPLKEVMLKVKTEIPPACESPIEEILLAGLLTTSIGFEAVTQFRVGRCRIDIAFPKIKLAVECDGREFHTSPADRESDERRDAFLARLGWRIRRFRGRDVRWATEHCVAVVIADYRAMSGKED